MMERYAGKGSETTYEDLKLIPASIAPSMSSSSETTYEDLKLPTT